VRRLPTPDLSPDDGVFLVYTSGTTGSPKGCLWTNDRLVETLFQILAEFRIDEERALLVVPEAHAAGGFGGGIAPLYRGGTVITLPDFHPVRTLEWVERESLTNLLAVPAILRALMGVDAEEFETNSLETIVSFGSPLPADLARNVDTRFDLNYFGNHMASTEGGWSLTRDVRENLDAASSPGTAALNVETRVVTIEEGEPGNPDGLCDLNETGELIVNSPHSMDRYLNQPKGTAESFRDGWYYTGDLGYVDTQGWFWPEGRKTNIIISGGINVSDVNVERVLTEHPVIATFQSRAGFSPFRDIWSVWVA
jgi:acyl-CoA synthetase (AMP-forming)/AMP-acid ligase II